MTLPLALVAGPLVPDDLLRFATLFTKSIFDFFPCESVRFLPLAEDDGGPADLAAAISRVREQGLPLVDEEKQELLLPVWAGETLCGLAVVRGGEEKFYAMPAVWLDEQSHIISREFHILKQSCQDPATGLLNGFHLRGELEALLGRAQEPQAPVAAAALALLEVYPRNRDADRSLRYIVRAGSCLASMLNEEMHLHHLGAGIFGLLWHGAGMEEARQLGEGLLLRLKRENFVSAHLGITTVVPHDPAESGTCDQLLDQAWQSLRTARKRGHFSLCGHATAKDIESHPLRETPEAALRELRRLWRGKERFSLALCRMDQEPASNHFAKRLRTVAGDGNNLVLVNQQEGFLFLDGAGPEEAVSRLEEFRRRMEAIGGSSFSLGVATYPYHDFMKSDLPGNCRKAVLHAAFFGPDSLVVFDAVSLNISGDVYYNEGDLVRAMREYRRGLRLDPASVNLLNSMGVACVQLNRATAARSFFQQALAADGKNFMALLNLGFVLLEAGNRNAARELWERALAVDPDHADLLQHLGVLCCRQGEFGRARELLGRCEELIRRDSLQGGARLVVARWLGRAQEALGETGAAIASYQRAVSGNPRDAGSLSRLGRLYAVARQGDDIALALCRQAVELDGGKGEHWYRLGWVQESVGDLEGASRSLGECLRLAPRHVEAALLLGRICLQTGQQGKARRVYEKVLRFFPDQEQARAALADLRR